MDPILVLKSGTFEWLTRVAAYNYIRRVEAEEEKKRAAALNTRK